MYIKEDQLVRISVYHLIQIQFFFLAAVNPARIIVICHVFECLNESSTLWFFFFSILFCSSICYYSELNPIADFIRLSAWLTLLGMKIIEIQIKLNQNQIKWVLVQVALWIYAEWTVLFDYTKFYILSSGLYSFRLRLLFKDFSHVVQLIQCECMLSYSWWTMKDFGLTLSDFRICFNILVFY